MVDFSLTKQQQELIEKHKKRLKNLLQTLKEKDSEKYQKVKSKIHELKGLQQENPDAFRGVIRRHPEAHQRDKERRFRRRPQPQDR